jgi:hypothetical protein
MTVARAAGLSLPSAAPEIVERVDGDAGTDFGVPSKPVDAERRPLDADEAERLATLLDACWRVFDQVVAQAPAELRKGPRGGGRDTAKIVDHVLGAEPAYTSAIGVKLKAPPAGEAKAIAEHRAAILAAVRAGGEGGKWPLRYFVRRTAWHVLDHAWEIEDRST